MSTIKQQVLVEYPDATLEYLTDIICYVTEKSIGSSVSTESAEDAWLDFKNRYCKPLPQPPMNYKELVLEKFPDTQVWKDAYGLKCIDSSITSEHKKTSTDAWKTFYEKYCTDKPDLIIGNEYEFSHDKENWYVATLNGYDSGRGIYYYIRPIQNNPKLDQLKQLAKELDFDLVPKNK